MTKKNPVTVYFMPPARPKFNIELGNSPMMGNKSAKVTIVEFSDFQCPYCAKGAEVLKEIKKKYGKKVNFVFKKLSTSFSQRCQACRRGGTLRPRAKARCFLATSRQNV